MLKEGHPYLYQLFETKEIPSFFKKAQKIGVVCGDVSRGFSVIDFDAKDGEPIGEVFHQYINDQAIAHIIKHNDLPIVQSPSGGFHIYFINPLKGIPSQKLALWESGKTMIETRGHGAYVATLPSEGYTQISGGDILMLSEITVAEYDCLIETAERLTRKIITNPSNANKSGKWPEKFDIKTVWGKYNEEELEEAKQLLRDAGWKFVRETETKSKIQYWLRPGKEEDGKAISASIGKCHNMFYCFTSNAEPFKEFTAYTPFDIFMLLKHGGDKEKATLELEDLYGIKHYNKTKAPTEPPPMPITVLPEPELQESHTPEPTKSIAGEFPIEVFPEELQQFILALNKSLNYSKDFVATSMMFAIATLNGNKYKLKVKNGWNAPTIFWFAVVGARGTMKTHPINTILEPIKEIDRLSKMSFDYDLGQWEQEQSEYKGKGKQKSTPSSKKPKFRQILINDITLESLHDVHNFNKRGLGSHRDELNGFINSMNQYRSGSDVEFWLESFNNGSYIVNRVQNEPKMIHNTMINIIGSIQPDTLTDLAKKFTGNGFIDRFLFTGAEKNIYQLTDNELDPVWLEMWRRNILNANSHFQYTDHEDTVLISMKCDALKKLIEIDGWICNLQQHDDVSDSMKNYLSKAKTYIPRLALLISLFDLIFEGIQPEVNATHIEKAYKIMRYFIHSAKEIFEDASIMTEIHQVKEAQRGKTTQENVIYLHSKGFKQARIAVELKISKQRVSKILSKQS